MSRVFNFSPGPAMLPEEVLLQVRDELLDWQRMGMSVMELPHRSKEFKRIASRSEEDLRELLSIPNDYRVLFLHGGARSQFAMIPMNLLDPHKQMAYAVTGIWSQIAAKEASLYGKVVEVTNNKDNDATTIAAQDAWKLPKSAAYLFYVDNETVNGLEFPYIPSRGGLPLVCDMSSNLLSRPVDVSKYGLIFASAQKNVGPAGITVVIIHDDLLKGTVLPGTPSMFRYLEHVEQKSMQNTPATFSWYVAGLVFQWIKKNGGVDKMGELNQRKSKKLYDFIDNSDFYHNKVDPVYRSRMNGIFTLQDEKLKDTFLEEANKGGLTNLEGHRFVGGFRASMYNAMPEIGVDTLIAFMRDFEKRYG